MLILYCGIFIFQRDVCEVYIKSGMWVPPVKFSCFCKAYFSFKKSVDLGKSSGHHSAQQGGRNGGCTAGGAWWLAVVRVVLVVLVVLWRGGGGGCWWEA